MAIQPKRRKLPKGIWAHEVFVSDNRIRCDYCEAQEFSEGLEWKEWWEDLKEAGWRTWKEDGDWRHACPDCMEERRHR